MKNIFLIGFMGSGKSTVGKIVSKYLRREFVDTDEHISRKFGMPITSVFQTQGEEKFRDAESLLLKKLSRRKGLVIATGGGLYERPENRQLIRVMGVSIFLDSSLDVIRTRLGDDEISGRPLWKNFSQVKDLFRERLETYRDCDFRIEVDSLPPGKIALKICSYIYPEREIAVNYEDYNSCVKISWDAPGSIRHYVAGRKTAIVTDGNVERLHLDRYREICDSPTVISVRPGEKSKTLKTAGMIYEKLLEARIGRDDLLLALGGGVITDIGGFVAATYKRGMDFILTGTTLVAAVDAAIGGKSAVDVGNIKNSVGLFTKPLVTVIDLLSLHTLKSDQIREGLVEAYKTGLVFDAKLCAYMRDNIRELNKGSVVHLSEVLARSAAAKCHVVSIDFRERDLRRILNLGHTYGHAVESYNNYTISHGMAVAQGMLVAIWISHGRGLMSGELARNSLETVKMICPKPVKLPTAGQAWNIMLNDKKNRSEKITFILLGGIGKYVIVNDVTETELDLAIRKAGES